MVKYVPAADFSAFMPMVMQVCFQRLQTRTEKNRLQSFVTGLLKCLSTYACLHGPDTLLELLDSVQPGLWVFLLQQVWIPNVGKVSGVVPRKACAVALVKLTCECPPLLAEEHGEVWVALMKTALKVTEGGASGEGVEAEPKDFEELSGFTAYARLQNAHIKEPDVLAAVPDARAYLAAKLGELCAQAPGQVPARLGMMEEDEQTALQGYLEAAGVALS